MNALDVAIAAGLAANLLGTTGYAVVLRCLGCLAVEDPRGEGSLRAVPGHLAAYCMRCGGEIDVRFVVRRARTEAATGAP